MKKSILLLFTSCLLSISCSKDSATDASNSQLKGNIIGQVSITDQYGFADKINSKDFKVSLLGNTNLLETITDATGVFKFNNVNAGTLKYKIAPKAGYVFNRNSDNTEANGEGTTFTFAGGSLDFDTRSFSLTPSIIEISKTSIKATLSPTIPSTVTAVLDPPIPGNKYLYVVAVMSNTSDVSNTKFLKSSVFYSSIAPYTYSLFFDTAVFPSKSTVYVKFYVCNPREIVYNYSGNPDLDVKTILSANVAGASDLFTFTQN